MYYVQDDTFSHHVSVSQNIDRHRARAIWLNYSEGKPEKTIVLVGKGLTYDTGGADIKAGGIMAGMHRDKGGASAVAGFMHAINLLKPGVCARVNNFEFNPLVKRIIYLKSY